MEPWMIPVARCLGGKPERDSQHSTHEHRRKWPQTWMRLTGEKVKRRKRTHTHAEKEEQQQREKKRSWKQIWGQSAAAARGGAILSEKDQPQTGVGEEPGARA